MELRTPFINAPISFLYSMMQSVNKNRFGKKKLKNYEHGSYKS